MAQADPHYRLSPSHARRGRRRPRRAEYDRAASDWRRRQESAATRRRDRAMCRPRDRGEISRRAGRVAGRRSIKAVFLAEPMARPNRGEQIVFTLVAAMQTGPTAWITSSCGQTDTYPVVILALPVAQPQSVAAPSEHFGDHRPRYEVSPSNSSTNARGEVLAALTMASTLSVVMSETNDFEPGRGRPGRVIKTQAKTALTATPLSAKPLLSSSPAWNSRE